MSVRRVWHWGKICNTAIRIFIILVRVRVRVKVGSRLGVVISPEPPCQPMFTMCTMSCLQTTIRSWLLAIILVDACILLIPIMLHEGRSPYHLDSIRCASFLAMVAVEVLVVMSMIDSKSKSGMLMLIVSVVVWTLIGQILLVHPPPHSS